MAVTVVARFFVLKRPPKAVRTVLAGEKFRTREKKLDAREGRAITAVFRVRKRLLDLGSDIPNAAGRTPDALAALVRSEIDKWTPIIKAAGVEAK